MSGGSSSPIKVMVLRRDDTCACGAAVAAGTEAGWHKLERRAICPGCLALAPPAGSAIEGIAPPPPPPPVQGAPGESLQREYERRSARREERVRTAHPRIGGLLLALTDEPASTRAFRIGADGETKAAERIQARCGPDVLFLFNRLLGRGRRDGDIDLIAIGPAGVFVADVKAYRNQRVEVRRSGGLLSPAREQLVINGRDRTALLDSLARQLDAVRTVVAELGDDAVPVRGALVFVDADLPLLSPPRIGGIPCLGSKQATKHFSTDGPYDAQARAAIHAHLAGCLPPA